MIFLVILLLIISIIFIKKRKQFPISERSPWLTFLGAISVIIGCLIIPISYAINFQDKLPEMEPYFNTKISLSGQRLVIRSIYIASTKGIVISYFLR